MSKKYVIVWVSEGTEFQNQGTSSMSKRVAEKLRDDLNRMYPTIRHDIKQVKDGVK